MLFVFQIKLEKSYLVRFQLHGQGVDKEPTNVLEIDNKGYVSVLRKVDYENSQGIKILNVSTP